MRTLLPTQNSLPTRALIRLVHAYRLLLSPWLGSACRFEPTCSAYALEALERFGAPLGTYLTLRRLARCQPFCEGGHDPVPQHAPRRFEALGRRPRGASHSSNPTDATSP